ETAHASTSLRESMDEVNKAISRLRVNGAAKLAVTGKAKPALASAAPASLPAAPTKKPALIQPTKKAIEASAARPEREAPRALERPRLRRAVVSRWMRLIRPSLA